MAVRNRTAAPAATTTLVRDGHFRRRIGTAATTAATTAADPREWPVFGDRTSAPLLPRLFLGARTVTAVLLASTDRYGRHFRPSRRHRYSLCRHALPAAGKSGDILRTGYSRKGRGRLRASRVSDQF